MGSFQSMSSILMIEDIYLIWKLRFAFIQQAFAPLLGMFI